MKAITGAQRLAGFDKPTVWSVMTPLAIKTKSCNLVPFYIENFRAKDSPRGNLPPSTNNSSRNQ